MSKSDGTYLKSNAVDRLNIVFLWRVYGVIHTHDLDVNAIYVSFVIYTFYIVCIYVSKHYLEPVESRIMVDEITK